MPTLLIEHSISDFDTWHDAFVRFATRRKQGGVLRERIMQPLDDPHYVLIELEFATLQAARDFLQFLETQVWSTPANSPALVGRPRARIAEAAPVDLGTRSRYMRSKLLIGGLGAAVAILLATSPVIAQAAGFITSADIGNNTIKSKDIKDHNLKGKDVKGDSLTGSEVDESSLGVVPNSTNLNGQPASAYLNRYYRIPVPTSANVGSFTQALPTTIPAGTFLATMNITASKSAEAGFYCLLSKVSDGTIEWISYGSPFGTFSTVQSAKVLTLSVPLQLECAAQSGTTFTSPPWGYPADELTFTALDTGTTTATARPAEGSPSTSGGVPGRG